MYKVVIVVLQDCDCSNTVYRKTHKIYTQPSIQGRLLANMVVGGNTASVTADSIVL